MNRMKTLFLNLLLIVVLAACGGGGDVAADVKSISVLPSGFNWTTDCSNGEGVAAAVSIHTINGGKPPFRLRSVVRGLEVGLVDANNQFVAPGSNVLNSEGDLILSGKDPKFAIRSTLSCDSDVSVLVLDYFSNTAVVNITVKDSKPQV